MIFSISVPKEKTKGLNPTQFKLSYNNNSISYVQTIEQLYSLEVKNVQAIIIPYFISCNQYNPKDFINHIRLENKTINKAPIIIICDNLKKINLDSYETDIYRYIGVIFVDGIVTTEIIEETKNNYNGIAYADFIDKITSIPSQDRHDLSNNWGSYVLTRTLYELRKYNTASKLTVDDLRYKKETLSLQHQLINTNPGKYKRLINGLDFSKNLVRRFSEQLSNIDFGKMNVKKVLIVEDRLVDGWQFSYEVFFEPYRTKILFASSELEFKNLIDEHDDIELFLLDMRLQKNSLDSSENLKPMPGVSITEQIRKKSQKYKIKTVPIIAATASSKTTTLESLLKYGIDGYWVKPSPDHTKSAEEFIKKTKDLYDKINTAIQWYRRTGRWQEELCRISKLLSSKSINKKASSLRAVLSRSFTPFSSDMDKGLQFNLAFLIIYSCLNDIIAACSEKVETDKKIEYYYKGFSDRVLVEKTPDGKWIVPEKDTRKEMESYPDSIVIERVLIFKTIDITTFHNLRKLRNSLPLTHGTEDIDRHPTHQYTDANEYYIDKLIATLNHLLS